MDIRKTLKRNRRCIIFVNLNVRTEISVTVTHTVSDDKITVCTPTGNLIFSRRKRLKINAHLAGGERTTTNPGFAEDNQTASRLVSLMKLSH